MIVLNAERELIVAGTTITVASVLHALKYYSLGGVLQQYPQLSDEDVLDCLNAAINALPRPMKLPRIDDSHTPIS